MADDAAMGKDAPDRSVWEACAGISGKMPKVGSLVYYFPRGHSEQARSPLDRCERACYLCKVRRIRLLANEETDEVYSEVELDPRTEESESVNEDECAEEESPVLSFAKVLTPSDANNGGGFSVPRFCADSIFPKLNFSMDPPSQLLRLWDLQGKVWEFRHIFRGTPRRHLLTTGWSRFVNSKKLVAGDSVIFMKNEAGKMFVGLRRNSQTLGAFRPESFCAKSGNRTKFTGKIDPEDVVEAVRSAEQGRRFKIIYYPRSSFSNFIVEKGAVDNALRIPWSAGLRVKMPVEAEDPSKKTWLQGTLSSIARHPSPWRSLEVAWDELEAGYIMKRVSPWEVEVVSGVVHVAASKRTRKNQEWPAGSADKKMRTWTNASLPAGMQGARQDPGLVLKGILPKGSFQLFGKTILIGHLDAADNDVAVDRENGGRAVDLCFGFSLSSPAKQFRDESDKPTQTISVLES